MFGFLLKCDEGEDSRYSCLLSSSTPVSRYREEGREERQGRETGRTFYSLRRQARMETEEEAQVEISSGQIFVYNFEGGWFWDILSFLDVIQNNFNIQTKTF